MNRIADTDKIEDAHDKMFQDVMFALEAEFAPKFDLDRIAPIIVAYFDAAGLRKEATVMQGLKDKLQNLRQIVALKPLSTLMQAYTHFEQRSKLKIYKIVGGTELGGHFDKRAKDQVISLRQDSVGSVGPAIDLELERGPAIEHKPTTPRAQTRAQNKHKPVYPYAEPPRTHQYPSRYYNPSTPRGHYNMAGER